MITLSSSAFFPHPTFDAFIAFVLVSASGMSNSAIMTDASQTTILWLRIDDGKLRKYQAGKRA